MKKLIATVLVVVASALLLSVILEPSSVDAQTSDHDRDDDGLIGITNLDQLYAIRWDLDGNGIVDSESNLTEVQGCVPWISYRHGLSTVRL